MPCTLDRLAVALLASLLAFTARAQARDGANLAAVLQPHVDKHVISGAVVLVADKDRVLNLEAVGFADLKTRRPMRTDDLFWIASMSKPITAAALLMLVDEGRVRLDEPVATYIPGFADLKVPRPDGTLTPPAHPITVREILSHTGGLRFLNAKDKQVIDSVPLRTSVEHDLLEPLLVEPGTAYKYSNEGIDAAGLIIEIVSGMPYEKFLQDRLFTPLGMRDTTFFPTSAQLKRLATTYKLTADKTGLEETRIRFLTYPLDGPGRHPAPGGGLFSTAHDVARFGQMLANEGTLAGKTYLSKEAVRQMTTKQTPPPVEMQYGLGLSSSADGRKFGHGGAYKTRLAVDHGIIRVFLVQRVDDWTSANPDKDFTEAVRKLYPGKATDSEPAAGGQLPTLP